LPSIWLLLLWLIKSWLRLPSVWLLLIGWVKRWLRLPSVWLLLIGVAVSWLGESHLRLWLRLRVIISRCRFEKVWVL
jgi:hypothetical protein